jgi:hypothetical protein
VLCSLDGAEHLFDTGWVGVCRAAAVGGGVPGAPEYEELADDAQYRERLGNYYSETYNELDTRM